MRSALTAVHTVLAPRAAGGAGDEVHGVAVNSLEHTPCIGVAVQLGLGNEPAYSAWTTEDHAASLRHYLLAAELGLPDSQLNAAFMLRKGMGTAWKGEERGTAASVGGGASGGFSRV